MKHIYDFESFSLLENFDLNQMFEQQNIIIEIQYIAKSIVNGRFNNVNEVPVDMQRNKDKVTLWLARQIKADYIRQATAQVTPIYNYENGDMRNPQPRIHNISLEYAQDILDYIKGKEVESVVSLTNFYSLFLQNNANKLSNIFDYFLSPVRNQHERFNLVSSTIDDLDAIQREWHNSLKASNKIIKEDGNILKKYPDGFYWIDLETNCCPEEANAMGHCGLTTGDTLLSLRRKSEGGFIEPFVTIAANYHSDDKSKYSGIHQIKGKNNKKPVAKYHPYIVGLLSDETLGIEEVLNDEYSPEDDFHISDLNKEQALELLKKNLFNKGYDFIKMYRKGILTEEETKSKLGEEVLFKDGKIYTRVKSFSDFEPIISKYHKSAFIQVAREIDAGEYGFDGDFSINTHFHLISDENIKRLLSKVNIAELKASDKAMNVLSSVDIDPDNLIDSVMNNGHQTNWKYYKLTKLIQLEDVLDSIEEIAYQLLHAYNLTKNKINTEAAKTHVMMRIEEELDTTVQIDGKGFLVELSDYITKNSDSYDMDSISYMVYGITIQPDRLIVDTDDDDTIKLFNEILKNNLLK
jgi:hypothetical protein